MKIKSLSVMLIAAAITSCSGNKSASNADSADMLNDQDVVAAIDLTGKWHMENIVVNDSLSVRPSEAVPGTEQYITFSDSTYSIQTNCNTISGSYILKGDSITLGDGPATLMACDNMATEDALRQIIPNISTVSVENDSTVKLNGASASAYILLHKASEK